MNLLVIAEGVETREQMRFCAIWTATMCRVLLREADAKRSLYRDAGQRRAGLCLRCRRVDWNEGTLLIGEKTGEQVIVIVDDVQLNRKILAGYFKNILYHCGGRQWPDRLSVY
jgi:hypothetical protein